MYNPPPNEQEIRNQLLAVCLAVLVLVAWQYLSKPYTAPPPAANKQESAAHTPPATVDAEAETLLEREEVLRQDQRVTIRSEALSGSLNLTGAKLDDLALNHYTETVDPKSAKVVLLAPSGTKGTYFASFGWLGSGTELPNDTTVWEADHSELTPEQPVTLRWKNKDSVTFQLKVSLDAHYMFTVEQSILNASASTVKLSPYGLVNRAYTDTSTHFAILHEGPLGVGEDGLEEVSYSKVKSEKKLVEEKAASWLGITDKYWLTAMFPPPGGSFKATYSYYESGTRDRYQVDFVSPIVKAEPGMAVTSTAHFFAGAKVVTLLDQYAEERNAPLFDRAIDFGHLYFLTKRLFYALNYFYHLLGNFGLAILLLTICVKIVMFPLAHKAYVGMAQMKKIMPKMEEVKARHKDDPLKLNQEIMALYKREKVNPASGCLPLIIQIPVFFALYKVLFVTIEMRHAPFFGWIHDLSAADPTNLFTLFGAIAWNPPTVLHIGIWPLIMGVTMILQYKLNPKPADPMQARIMAWLPYIFTYMLANFPAGLVIYWAWNNTLSIIQQWFIMKRVEEKPSSRPAKG